MVQCPTHLLKGICFYCPSAAAVAATSTTAAAGTAHAYKTKECPGLCALLLLPTQARGVEGSTIQTAANCIKWEMEFLKGSGDAYSVDLLTRHTAQLSQLGEFRLQLGVQRRPLADLQQLIQRRLPLLPPRRRLEALPAGTAQGAWRRRAAEAEAEADAEADAEASCVGFCVLLALAWGFPNGPEGDQACHMCCDNPRCMKTSVHGCWGSRSHNRTEPYIIKAWRHVWREAPASVQALHPSNPARFRLWVHTSQTSKAASLPCKAATPGEVKTNKSENLQR